MSYEEFKEILVIIESNYSTFELSEYQQKFWYEQLKSYSFEDIKKQIEYHIIGEYGDRWPKPYWLIKNLRTIEQKENADKIFMVCPFCKKQYEFPIDNFKWEKCHERCSSIAYIELMSNRFNIKLNEIFPSNIRNLKLTEINEYYYHFLEEVYKNFNQLTEEEQTYLTMTLKTAPHEKLHKNKLNI